jgi:hypothetical protein
MGQEEPMHSDAGQSGENPLRHKRSPEQVMALVTWSTDCKGSGGHDECGENHTSGSFVTRSAPQCGCRTMVCSLETRDQLGVRFEEYSGAGGRRESRGGSLPAEKCWNSGWAVSERVRLAFVIEPLLSVQWQAAQE